MGCFASTINESYESDSAELFEHGSRGNTAPSCHPTAVSDCRLRLNEEDCSVVKAKITDPSCSDDDIILEDFVAKATVTHVVLSDIDVSSSREHDPTCVLEHGLHLVSPSTNDVSVSRTPSDREDDLLLDFDTFTLIASVQDLLDDNCVDVDTLKELFDINDKDGDGFINDKEREDLLQLLDLSFSKDSPYSMHGAVSNTDRLSSPESPSTPGYIDRYSTLAISPSTTIDRDLDATSPSTTIDRCFDATSPSTIIDRDFDAVTAQLKEHVSRSAVRHTHNAVALPNPPMQSDKTVRPPPEKRGFLVKHESYQTIQHRPQSFQQHSMHRLPSLQHQSMHRPQSLQQQFSSSMQTADKAPPNSAPPRPSPNSRFFLLDKGSLSYMDSTSKKPPFSLSNRELSLCGMQLRADNERNTIELSTSCQSGQSCGEVVVLGVKTSSELDDWIEALQNHIHYSETISATETHRAAVICSE